MIKRVLVNFDTGIIYDAKTPEVEVAKVSLSADIPSGKGPTRAIKCITASGKTVYLCYGGFINNTFERICSIPCRWGKSCIRFGKHNCKSNPDFRDIDFYIVDKEI